MIRLLLALLVAVALAVAYFFVALTWSYSTGERAGWVQKLSKKGWVCKTWEGELAMVSMPGATPEKFPFTIFDDDVAAQITKAMGRRVSLHYEEKVGLPTTCFGETRHFVTGVTESPDIPLGPGVVLPQGPAPAPAASGTPGVPPGASGTPGVPPAAQAPAASGAPAPAPAVTPSAPPPATSAVPAPVASPAAPAASR